jgi:hypothetical protein
MKMREIMQLVEGLDSWGRKHILVNPGREKIRHWISTIMARRPKWEIAKEEDDNRLEYEDMAARGTVDVDGRVYVVDAYLATHATLHDSVESACDFYISADYVIHADYDASWITPEQKDAMLKWGERWQMPVVKRV